MYFEPVEEINQYSCNTYISQKALLMLMMMMMMRRIQCSDRGFLRGMNDGYCPLFTPHPPPPFTQFISALFISKQMYWYTPYCELS